MPRPRSQRAPLAPLAADDEAPGPVFDDSPPPPSSPEQPPPRRQQDPAEEQMLRCMPNALNRELKLGALGWRGICFCCPATISFGQCIAGLWQAARKPSSGTDSLVHWGLNAMKFIFQAGPQGDAGRALLLHAGYPSLVPPLLSLTEEVPQTIALTPQVSFVQVFATGGRQLPLTTNPQLVMMSLLANVSTSPAGLAAVAASPDLIPSIVRTLAASTDDRFRSLALQTLSEWVVAADDAAEAATAASAADAAAGGADAVQQRRRRDGVAAGAVGLSAEEQRTLLLRMLDAGLVAVAVDALERSLCAPVLRDACAVLLPLLAGPQISSGGGGPGGHVGGGVGGGHGGRAPSGLAAVRLPQGAALEGTLRCRARTEAIKAGLIPALLGALSRKPSQLRFWLVVNLGVSGTRFLELQWWLLVLARTCLLPTRSASQLAGGTKNPAAAAAVAAAAAAPVATAAVSGPSEPSGPSSAAAAAASTSTSTSTSTSAATGAIANGSSTSGKGTRKRGAKGSAGGPAGPELDEQRLMAAAVEAVLQFPGFARWLAELDALPELEAAEAEARPGVAAAGVAAGGGTDGQAEASGSARAEGSAAGSGAAARQPSAQEKAVQLLCAVLSTCSTRSCCLPEGVTLEELPPRERNATPDWRAAQRERIAKAAEEAKAAQAQASAAAAVDVLTEAMATAQL